MAVRSVSLGVIRDHAVMITAISEEHTVGDPAIYACFDETEDPQWDIWESDFPAISIAYEQDTEGLRGTIALDKDGAAYFLAEGQDEIIPGAGLYRYDSEGYGYVECIRQIGQSLYVCGYAGQVYQRRGPGDWVHLDDGLLQTELHLQPRISLRSIDGPHERAIYVAGCLVENGLPPFLAYYNGQHWRRLSVPANAEQLTGVYAESAERIWLCGANGTLLLGNAERGFVNLSKDTDNAFFYNITRHQGRLYLSSNLGLFVYNPERPDQGIARVLTGLTPELEGVVSVGCDKHVLWVLAAQDLVRFDGQRWERMEQPYLHATLTPPTPPVRTGPPPYLPKDDSLLAEALARRTGYYAVDDFIRELVRLGGKDEHTALPDKPASIKRIRLPQLGVEVDLRHPHAGLIEYADPARWIIDTVALYPHDSDGGHFAGPLPAGLDPEQETLSSIEAKLGAKGQVLNKKRLREGFCRESYFLPDGLVISVHWKKQPDGSLRGIDKVLFGRLGKSRAFPDPARYPLPR